MNKIIMLILYYLSSIFLGLLLFTALMSTELFSIIDIIFYRGIILAIIAGLLLACANMVAMRRWRAWLDGPTALAATSLSLSFNLCFLVIVPVTIDRSISVFLLARIEQAGPQGLSRANASRLFVRDYVDGMDQIGRRFDEQLKTGNIQFHNGRAVISPQGQRFLALARMVSNLMHTDPRFLAVEDTERAMLDQPPPTRQQ